MAITDAWLKAHQGRTRSNTLEKTDRDGLGARVTPMGKISFQLRYRYDGVYKRTDLATYPRMSLKQARDEMQRLRGRLEQGHDPKIIRLLEKQAIIKADSIEAMFR